MQVANKQGHKQEFSFDEKQQDERFVEEELHEENHSLEEEASPQANAVEISRQHPSIRGGQALARTEVIKPPGENEKIKINKVNEMDIKVSRFEKSPQMHGRHSYQVEEVIPSEEPLIQIRQFNGGGAASSLQQLPAPPK